MTMVAGIKVECFIPGDGFILDRHICYGTIERITEHGTVVVRKGDDTWSVHPSWIRPDPAKACSAGEP